MSAVVITLTTPLLCDCLAGRVRIAGVPDGDYDLHVWIEGQRQNALDKQTRRVHVAGEER